MVRQYLTVRLEEEDGYPIANSAEDKRKRVVILFLTVRGIRRRG